MGSLQNKTSNSSPTVTWWVVFKNADEPWINGVCRDGFGHCLMFTRMHNLTMMIEPHLGVVNHVLTDANIAELLAEQKAAGNTVVFFRHAPQPMKMLVRTPMITCASYLAYTMGLPFFGVTPHQLYKKLIKRGGETI